MSLVKSEGGRAESCNGPQGLFVGPNQPETRTAGCQDGDTALKIGCGELQQSHHALLSRLPRARWEAQKDDSWQRHALAQPNLAEVLVGGWENSPLLMRFSNDGLIRGAGHCLANPDYVMSCRA